MKLLASRLLTPHAACAAAIATLAGAFAFQHLGGLEPCPICIWQRWPYAAGAALAATGIVFGGARSAQILHGGALVVFLAGAVLSAWHAGIEYGFWSGPATCSTAMDLGDLSGEALLNAIEARPLVRCDTPEWTLAGISLAGWSVLIQLAIAGMLVRSVRSTETRPTTT